MPPEEPVANLPAADTEVALNGVQYREPVFPRRNDLRAERDADVREADPGRCSCFYRTRGGIAENLSGCLSHDPQARALHLGIAQCDACGSESLVGSMDGGWCAPCNHEAGEVAGPFVPTLTEF